MDPNNLFRPLPLLLSSIFIILIIFFRIPSYWESGFHTSYLYFMLTFFAYILYLFSRDDTQGGKDNSFFKSFGKILLVVCSLYIGMQSIFNFSESLPVKTFLQMGIFSAVCVIIYLLFQMRVEKPEDGDIDVFNSKHRGDISKNIKSLKEKLNDNKNKQKDLEKAIKNNLKSTDSNVGNIATEINRKNKQLEKLKQEEDTLKKQIDEVDYEPNKYKKELKQKIEQDEKDLNDEDGKIQSLKTKLDQLNIKENRDENEDIQIEILKNQLKTEKDKLRSSINDDIEKYNKSYIATVLTQPLYVVIDLFGIIKCLFSDKEERQKLQSLIVKYFKDHKYALLVIASLSTYLYFWFRDTSIQLNPNVLSKTLIPRDPLPLDQQYVIGKQSEGIRTYNYSISGWVFIEQPVDNEDREFKIIDYAGAPIITYNPSNQMLYAYINKSENGKLVRVMEFEGMKHQRWNYFVVNSSDGVVDIFWNTTLIATIDNIVPYMKNDAFITGEFQGIRGGIKNVEYREVPINMWTMYLSYYFM